ncbi:MAG TPA: hypothetical protein VGU19_17140 [Microvirga sp.]|nr:hypothetical protein [Microvirga sp.]
MATNKKDGTSQPSRSRKASATSASRSATKTGTAAQKRAQPKASARSATKSQAVPAKARSSAGSRPSARSASSASRPRSTTRARSASRQQGGLLNPMAWLSTLETTLTSPQARAVMAEALRAVANVLEAPHGGGQAKGGGAQEGRKAVSAAGSLGAEIVAAPLEVAAAAIGAAGDVLTSALSGSPGENGGNGTNRTGGRASSRKKS